MTKGIRKVRQRAGRKKAVKFRSLDELDSFFFPKGRRQGGLATGAKRGAKVAERIFAELTDGVHIGTDKQT